MMNFTTVPEAKSAPTFWKQTDSAEEAEDQGVGKEAFQTPRH